ncbi:MAG: hypothetical protein ACYCR7_06925 [Thermoplasmataceae archaeon]
MRLKQAIKWYTKGLFPEPHSILLYAFVFIIQIYTLLYLKNGNELFISTTQLLLIPMIGLMNGLHMIRDDSVTIFELSLLRSWRNIAISKIIVTLVSFIPFLILEFVIVKYYGISYEFSGIAETVLIVASIILFSSLMHSFSVSFTSLFIFLFLLPASSTSLLANLQTLKTTAPYVISVFGYLFSPLTAYEYYTEGVITLSPTIGFYYALTFTFIMILFYYEKFMLTQYKP